MPSNRGAAAAYATYLLAQGGVKENRGKEHLMGDYDVVIAGAGQNGLSAACYLAKAGLKVCILEGKSYVGGGSVSIRDEFGASHDVASTGHMLIQQNPLIKNDELGLMSKYGLKYVSPEATTVDLFVHKGFSITLWKDIDRACEEIATKLNESEAKAYREFYDFCQAVGPMLCLGMFGPPIPAEDMASALMGFGEIGLRLARYTTMSAYEIATELFETDELREVTTRFVSESMIGPFDPGTGSSFVAVMYMLHDGNAMAQAAGGSGALSDAMVAFCKDYGVEIRTNARIAKVLVEDGACTGFQLDSGEVVTGKRYLATLNVKQLFGSKGLVDPALMDPEFTKTVDNLRPSYYVALLQNITLSEVPDFKLIDGVGTPATVTEQSRGYEHFKFIFDELHAGHPSPADSSAIVLASIHDPLRAGRNGETTLYLYNYEPYELYGDHENWKKYGDQIADEALEAFFTLTTNMDMSKVLYRSYNNPLDYENWNESWLAGDFCHISQESDQGQSNRPFPGMSRYVTPIKGLYLGGASAWPGPVVSGGGRAVAQVLFEEMEIDFDATING